MDAAEHCLKAVLPSVWLPNDFVFSLRGSVYAASKPNLLFSVEAENVLVGFGG